MPVLRSLRAPSNPPYRCVCASARYFAISKNKNPLPVRLRLRLILDDQLVFLFGFLLEIPQLRLHVP